MMSVRPYSGTQAVSRAIALLKTFSDAQPEWNLAQLAQAVNLNKTTAYRLLRALETEGMVGRNRDTGAYRLGPEAIAVGGRALRCNDVRFAGHGALEILAQRVGEAATLEILVGDQVMVLDEVPGGHLLATLQSVGARYAAHATSTGKVLLAYLSDEERGRVLRPPLARLTEHTIADPDELEREMTRVRRQGFALAHEELESGYVAAAAPVRHHDGQVVAAVSVGGPSTRLCGERLEDAVNRVKEAAATASGRLGYCNIG